jgi:hypothetical protein
LVGNNGIIIQRRFFMVKKSRLMGRLRKGMLIISLVWAAAVIGRLYKSRSAAVESFRQEEYGKVEVNASGALGDIYLNQNAKKKILTEIADEIGINQYGIVIERNDNQETTTLSQTGTNGTVVCRITTTEQPGELGVQSSQELLVRLLAVTGENGAGEYTELIREIFKGYGIAPSIAVTYYGI